MARPTILSLFSGVGGLELGIQIAMPGARVLGLCERDAYAASVLLARMEDSSLERAPVFIGDICDLDGRELRDRVDILCGGFPCQDISVAGQGAGISGKRSGLWSEIVRLADEIRPRYIFLENVAAITSRGLDAVLADLASLGFDAEWLCLRASDVGAPHQRNRWFCLAYRDGDGCGLERGGWLLDGKRTAQRDDADGCDETMADPKGFNGRQGEPQRSEELAYASRSRRPARQMQRRGNAKVEGSPKIGKRAGLRGEALDDPMQQQRGGRSRTRPNEAGGTGGVLDNAMCRRHEHEEEKVRAGRYGSFPPGPADLDAWRDTPAHLAPAVESSVCVVVDGKCLVVDASRADQLRCAGNGVVALQAAVAFVELMRRIKSGAGAGRGDSDP